MRDPSVRAARLAADSSGSVAARRTAMIPCRAVGEWLLPTHTRRSMFLKADSRLTAHFSESGLCGVDPLHPAARPTVFLSVSPGFAGICQSGPGRNKCRPTSGNSRNGHGPSVLGHPIHLQAPPFASSIDHRQAVTCAGQLRFDLAPGRVALQRLSANCFSNSTCLRNSV